jgi:hypothetical protein
MASMTNLLLKDDTATPVEFTLAPINDAPPLWRAGVAGVPFEGQIRCTVMANEKTKDGSYRRVLKLEVPILETLGASGTSAGYVAPQKVAYVETFILTQYSSSRSAIADRANSLKLMIGVIAGGSATTATATLDGASAGDAWKNSTAFGPRFFIHGESAS